MRFVMCHHYYGYTSLFARKHRLVVFVTKVEPHTKVNVGKEPTGSEQEDQIKEEVFQISTLPS